MAGQARAERVQEALRQEISKIVHDELKDPRLGFVTITRVELTKDLRFARIFFSVLEDHKKSSTLKALKSATGFIRRLIGERVKLQFVPDIAFALDESFAHTKRVYDILERLKEEKRGKEDVDKKGNKGPEEI
jgi:ribosome-binding factor A